VTASLAPIRVLIVDDSTVIRGILGKIIDAEPDLRVVTTAENGMAALVALRYTPADVVILDIEMPEMDGLTALPLILARHPRTRVLMASSLTQKGAEVTMRALALGAADYVAKPSAKQGTKAMLALASDLVAKVRALGRAGSSRASVAVPQRPAIANASVAGSSDQAVRVLAIAASTGGPNALAEVLAGLPPDFPLPIVITQHMPPIFTALLAQRLSRDGRRECVEGRDGELVRPGRGYVAPGDFHMTVGTVEGQPILRLTKGPPENFCRPAADPMFRSVAAAYGASVLAVVLTGMGEDGRRGAEEIVRRGGRIIVQDEASSIVWGMPGAVANAGLASAVLPLRHIASHVTSRCCVSP
jgi:two-component system chemotaxis response regulator CheB